MEPSYYGDVIPILEVVEDMEVDVVEVDDVEVVDAVEGKKEYLFTADWSSKFNQKPLIHHIDTNPWIEAHPGKCAKATQPMPNVDINKSTPGGTFAVLFDEEGEPSFCCLF
jgi:hypothetical protein